MTVKGVIFDFSGTISSPNRDVYDGVESLLKQLKKQNFKIGIASRSSKQTMINILENSKLLDYFDEIVSGEDVKQLKPDPECYLLCSYRLGTTPEEFIAVEDSATGISAAKSAGAKCIAITNTHTIDELKGADYIVNTYEEIYDIIASV
jgi:HAD superfamily hydrolase (TIGR01509 family)